MTFKEAIVKAFENEPIASKYTKREIVERVKKIEDIEESSIIPSDYCYNRSNLGIIFNTYPHLFIIHEDGTYEYIGEGANYQGDIVHINKDTNKKRVVGKWSNGKAEFTIRTVDSVWVGAAVLAFNKYHSSKDIKPEDMYFRQADIARQASFVHGCKVPDTLVSSQCVSGRGETTYNYLVAGKGTSATERRLSFHKEFSLNKERPNINASLKVLTNKGEETIDKIYKFIEEEYTKIFGSIKEEGTAVNSWLISWNKDKWPWEDYDTDVKKVKKGSTFIGRWTCSNTNVSVNDRVYLIKLGGEPRGIIAGGHAIGESYDAPHWDPEKKEEGAMAKYIQVEFKSMLDYKLDDILLQETLKEKLPDQQWSPFASGISIKQQYVNELEELWQSTISNNKEKSPIPSEDSPIDEESIRYADYTPDDFLTDVYMSKEKYITLKNLLIKKKNIILQGAPGVGKTYAAERLAYSIMEKKDTSRVMVIQFHQSYSYEDFIMGYRPNDSGFSLAKGPFYKFCKEAEGDDREYFFIIDEINRGNLSKIFGELLMLIENDKRGKGVQLLYADEQFSVPPNVYIIGMMNTADRSLAMIDYALRRRFSFFEFEPAFASEGFKKYQISIANRKFDRLIATVVALNKDISDDASLGSGFQVGHSYFCTKDVVDDAWLSDVVEYELVPLIKEYWFDEPSKVDHWILKLRGAIDE